MNQSYENLKNEVCDLIYYWQIYRNVYAKSEKQIKTLQEIDNEFFGSVQKMYLESIIMHIIRLTEGERTAGKTNLTLKKIMNEYRKELSSNNIKELNKIISNIDGMTNDIRDYRNKNIGHLDYVEKLENSSSMLLPSRKRIEEIVDSIIDFMNKLENLIDNCTTIYPNRTEINGGTSLINKLENLELGK